MVNKDAWQKLHVEFAEKGITLVAVSKKKPVSEIKELYELGQRDFGENYVQELEQKYPQLPGDINWHYIGHLQANKVKYIASFVHLIQTVDSFNLLLEINKQALKNGRIIDVLLQMHIAEEETKFGFDEQELNDFIDQYKRRESELNNVRICGLMGMATNTADEIQIHAELFRLHNLFSQLAETAFPGQPYFSICSMGMSADYNIAIQQGSNMVRIGSLIFGNR